MFFLLLFRDGPLVLGSVSDDFRASSVLSISIADGDDDDVDVAVEDAPVFVRLFRS